GDVAGHAGNKAGQQRRQPQTKNAGGKVTQEQRRNGEIVIELRPPVFVTHDFARALAHFVRNHPTRSPTRLRDLPSRTSLTNLTNPPSLTHQTDPTYLASLTNPPPLTHQTDPTHLASLTSLTHPPHLTHLPYLPY